MMRLYTVDSMRVRIQGGVSITEQDLEALLREIREVIWRKLSDRFNVQIDAKIAGYMSVTIDKGENERLAPPPPAPIGGWVR